MTSIVNIMLALQLLACVALVIYLVTKLRRHTKVSPAEKALKMHLVELEAAAAQKKQPATKKKSAKK